MAQDIYGLTKADIEFLKALKRAHDGNRQNPPSARVGYDGFDECPQAPEVYIALVPSGGIPANEGDPELLPGTGTELDFQQGDTPGHADCQIYRIINGVLHSCDFTKRVYNLSEAAIDQQWVTIVRDKWGQWIAQTGGGSTPCEDRNEKWSFSFFGPPTGGNVSWITTVKGTSSTITFAYNASNTTVKTALEGHAKIAVGEVEVTGGPLPATGIQVEFKAGLAGKLIPVPFVNIASLTGTGIGGQIVRIERGLPGDATEA